MCFGLHNVYAYLPRSLALPIISLPSPHPPRVLSFSLSHTHTLPRGSSLAPPAVPGFPVSTVSGHAGSMILGTLSGYVLTTCRSPPVVHHLSFTPPMCVGVCSGPTHTSHHHHIPHGSPQCGSLQWVGSPWFAVGVVAVGGSPRRWTAVRPWSPQAVRHPESPPPPPPPPRAREGVRCAILVQPLHPAGHRFPPTVHIHTQSTPVGTINVAPYHPSSWPSVCFDAPSLLTRPHVTTSRHPSLPPHPIPPHSSFPHPLHPFTLTSGPHSSSCEFPSMPVACLSGRVHLYEGNDPGMTRLPIYTLKLLGCEIFFATSAVGSLRESSGPGSFVSGR